jgi:hypothetical protein
VKTYKILLLFLLSGNTGFTQIINPNWSFVGPRSENEGNNNKFRTSRLNCIAVNPGNSAQIIVGGQMGGLWKSNNTGANWANINTIPIGSNGISAVAFRNSNELYVSDYFESSSHANYSTGVFKYDLSTGNWLALPVIPNNTNPHINFRVNKIVFFPGNSNVMFICTTIGLFKSINTSGAWGNWIQESVTGNISTMAFIKKATGLDYFCYVAGSDIIGYDISGPLGKALLMESSINGTTFALNTFSTISAYTSIFTKASRSAICLGDQTNGTGNRDIFIHTIVPDSVLWDSFGYRQVHRFTKNIK